jgi:probable HAF family extracellular repeat protein
MKSKTLTYITAMTLFAALAIPVRLAAQEQKKGPPRYTITDLGTLGGTFSAASGVNNEGAVLGASSLPGDTVVRVFIWQNGVMTDLGTLGGPNSIDLGPNPINNRGAVVGSSNTSTPDPNGEDFCFDPASLVCLPFVWQHGVMTPLPLLGGINGAAFQLNNRGQIVGAAENSTPDPTCEPPQVLQLRAVIWEKGQVRELPPFLGDPDATAGAINDKGQAVGSSGPCTLIFGNSFHALLWQNGRAIDLGNLGGATGNIAIQINNRGQIVGQSGRSDGFVHAFLWENGVMADLGALSGSHPISQALGINEKGQVVGFAQDANGDESSSIALLWQNGILTDLNSLIPADSPWFLQEAFSINDRGQIVGHMFNTTTGEVHGFLATPVPGSESAPPAAQGEIRESPTVILPGSIRQLLERRLGFARLVRSPQEVTLSKAAVISAPTATLSPTSLTFSTQAIGTTSAAKTVTLKNTGTATLTITAIAITGTNAGDYFRTTTTCGSSLAVGASCSINVTFKPTVSGTRSAALAITDNAAGSPQKVTLSGIGTTAKLSPSSLNFGTVAIGTASPAKTVTLTNVGTTTLTITAIASTGTNAGDFAQTYTCGSSLAAGASCQISVKFKPTVSGTRTAALSITDNAAGSPQHVPLSGIGTTAKLSPTSLSFGSVAIGSASPAQTVTLTNVGTTTLTVTGIAITGTNAGDFVQTNTCMSSLAAGASCSISVTFKPTEFGFGTRTAALSFSDNAAGSPQKVFLSGTELPCPAVLCSSNHTQGTLCGGHCFVFGSFIYKAYDLTYKRVCYYRVSCSALQQSKEQNTRSTAPATVSLDRAERGSFFSSP